MNKLLNAFKTLSINKKDLTDKIGEDLYNIDCKKPEQIRTSDVINAISSFLNHSITKEQLLDWVNVIWFTDLFEFKEDDLESIVSVLQVLETMDEDDVSISDKELFDMIVALQKNKEY